MCGGLYIIFVFCKASLLQQFVFVFDYFWCDCKCSLQGCGNFIVVSHVEMWSKPSSFSVFQTIAFFTYLAGRLNDEGPFLILCPLSVLSNWKEEIERYKRRCGWNFIFHIKVLFSRCYVKYDKTTYCPKQWVYFFQKTLTWGSVDRDWGSIRRGLDPWQLCGAAIPAFACLPLAFFYEEKS